MVSSAIRKSLIRLLGCRIRVSGMGSGSVVEVVMRRFENERMGVDLCRARHDGGRRERSNAVQREFSSPRPSPEFSHEHVGAFNPSPNGLEYRVNVREIHVNVQFR